MVITLLSIMGLTAAYLVASNFRGSADHVMATQAEYVTQAGLEYAVKKVWEGGDPVVTEPGKPFGRGNFLVDWTAQTLTVTGRVGNSVQRIHRITSPSQADCTIFDFTNMRLTGDGTRVTGIQFRKNCLPILVLDKVTVSWEPNDASEKITQIKIEDDVSYSSAGETSGTLLELADYTVAGINNVNMNKIDFNASMEGKVITMAFVMGDGSLRTITFGPLDD